VRRTLADLRRRAELWLDGLAALPFDAGVLRKLRRVVLHRRDQLQRA